MINQQLLDYIRGQKEAGTDDAEIKENLESAGWRSQDVEEGFQAIENNLDGGEDNSTAAHQQMREEAAASREGANSGDSSSAQDSAETQTDAVSQSDGGAGDPYREEPEVSDDASATKSDDGSAGEEGQSLADISSDDESSSSDTSGESDSASTEASGDGQGSSDISAEQMRQMQGESGPENAEDFTPKELRTFEEDHRAAGGDPGARSRPESAQSGSQDEGMESVGPVGGSGQEGQAEAGPGQGMSDERKEYEDREKKAAAEESDLNKALSGEAVKKRGSEGQRFSAQKGGGEIAKRRKQSRSGGAGWVSIALFVLAVLLVGGGGYYGYATYFSGPQVQDTSAAQVMQSLANAGSFNYRMVVNTSDDPTGESEPEQVAVLEGYLDLNNENSAESYYEFFAGSDGESFEAVTAETESLTAVPDEQLAIAREKLLSPQFFSIGEFQTTEQLGETDTAAGFPTNRFSASIDTDQFIADYANLHQALFDEPLAQDVLNNLQDTVGAFQPTQGQAWIGQENGVPYQLTFFGKNAAGDDVQVDLMFKNHGSTPTEPTPAFTPQPFADTLASYFQSGDNVVTPPGPATTTPPTDPPAGEETAPPTDGPALSAAEQARRTDRLRVNDAQQIAIALAVYADENGSYPQALSSLVGGPQSLLSEIPADPETGAAYRYSVSRDGSRFHLGSTLRQLRRPQLTSDADFNSRAAAEFETGFNGTATSCLAQPRPSVTTSTCYDVVGTVDQ